MYLSGILEPCSPPPEALLCPTKAARFVGRISQQSWLRIQARARLGSLLLPSRLAVGLGVQQLRSVTLPEHHSL